MVPAVGDFIGKGSKILPWLFRYGDEGAEVVQGAKPLVVTTKVQVDNQITNQMRIKNKAQQARDTAPPVGLGSRILSPAERAEFNNFALNARAKGLFENPNRTGSWGEYINGRFRERVRIDVGEAGKPGWRGMTHLNFPGQPGHFPIDTPIP